MKTVEIKVTTGTNKILQKAVDDCYQAGGGTVKISAGTFHMFDSLHLRSNVNIIGTKGKTIFKKCRSFSSKLSADIGYGHYDVSVEKPHLFKPGMGIYIRDANGMGFYGTVATITWKDKDSLGISRMLNHDYARIRNAMVSTIFPVISGYYASNLVIENITIDGNGRENDFIDGCRGGGIFLLQCHGIKLKGVTEKNYNGDGISFQQCTKLMIEECEVLNNYGSGLHPGSGSAGVIMRNCKIRGNGKDGVFYCLRVTYTLLEDCEISENGNDGISIGARDTDHIIRSNFITKNCRYGIYFRKADRVMGGHRNLIDSNIIVNNCQKEGKAEVFIEDTTEDIWFKKNKIQGGKNLQFGIIAGKSCKRICLGKDNEFINLKHNVSPDIVFSYSLPRKISVGPEYLNNKSVRHLNIELQ